MMLFVNAFLFYILMRVIKLTKQAKEMSVFTDQPAIPDCKRHEWSKTYVYENNTSDKVMYCKECGYISDDKNRYFKAPMLAKLRKQSDLSAAFYLIDKSIKEEFLQGLKTRTDIENSVALEKLILDLENSKQRMLSEKFELMKM
jgi:hypothetical protein